MYSMYACIKQRKYTNRLFTYLFSVEQKNCTHGLAVLLLSDDGGRYMTSEKQVNSSLSSSVLKRNNQFMWEAEFRTAKISGCVDFSLSSLMAVEMLTYLLRSCAWLGVGECAKPTPASQMYSQLSKVWISSAASYRAGNKVTLIPNAQLRNTNIW